MLIRSQDKLKLISLDGIKYLEIEQGFSADEKNTVWAVCGDDEATVIGVYSTQEKAQAVMDDIEASVCQYERAKTMTDTELFTFYMPEDDDPWFNMENPDRVIDRDTATSCLALVEKYIKQNKGAHVAITCQGGEQVEFELEGGEHE